MVVFLYRCCSSSCRVARVSRSTSRRRKRIKIWCRIITPPRYHRWHPIIRRRARRINRRRKSPRTSKKRTGNTRRKRRRRCNRFTSRKNTKSARCATTICVRTERLFSSNETGKRGRVNTIFTRRARGRCWNTRSRR